MPTYQSSPLLPLIFPDQAFRQNYQGVQPLRGNVLELLPLEKSSNPSWKPEAEFSALAKVQNTLAGQQAMLKGPQSIKGNKSFTTYRGPNQEAFKQSTFSGGRVRNRDSEKMVSHLLQDRIKQLDALDESNFEEVKPERLVPQLPQSDTFVLDKLFSDLLSSLNEGVLSNALLGFMGSIMSFLATKGDKIPEGKFDTYLDISVQIETAIQVGKFKYIFELYSKEAANKLKFLLDKLSKDIKLVKEFLFALNAFRGQPIPTKSLKLAALRTKLFDLSQLYKPFEQESGEDMSFQPGDEQTLNPEERNAMLEGQEAGPEVEQQAIEQEVPRAVSEPGPAPKRRLRPVLSTNAPTIAPRVGRPPEQFSYEYEGPARVPVEYLGLEPYAGQGRRRK
jgi:hypothetical protein